MYLSFYELKIKPFQNSANPSFCWLGETHKEALVIFKYGILEMPGFFLLTGDVGTGKTTLVNVLINRLGGDFIVVKVPDPSLDEIDFVNYLSDALDFKEKFTCKDTFLTHFSHFLNKSASIGKKILLIIDECQRLNFRLLEEIIKLSEIETVGKKTLKVLLIGQNDFNDGLQKNKTEALEQLITIKYAIAPLDLAETGEFVKHRLRIAGAKKTIFSPDAITKIYQFSAGIPRRINIICDHALLSGFRQRTKIINGSMVRGCAEDLCPPGFSTDQNIDSSDLFASADFQKKAPDSREKVALSWAGKTFVAVLFITTPLSLMPNFTDQTKYRDVIDYIIPVSNERMSEAESFEISDKKRSAKVDVENVVSVVPLEQGETGARPNATIDSNPKDDIPTDDTLDIVAVEDTYEEHEINDINDTDDIAAYEENIEEDKNSFDKETVLNLNPTTEVVVNQLTKIDLPDNLVRPDKSEGIRAAVDEQPENVDPGAVIDWVIKNHSK